MFELIYASAESQPFSSADLTQLLAKARKNNQALGVSGLLLYHSGSFLQLLEGELETVEALYRKIAQDPRHERAKIIKRGDVAERNFADWSMGFVDVNFAVAKRLQGFNSFLEHGVLPSTKTAEHVSKVLYGFRDGAWRQHVN